MNRGKECSYNPEKIRVGLEFLLMTLTNHWVSLTLSFLCCKRTKKWHDNNIYITVWFGGLRETQD